MGECQMPHLADRAGVKHDHVRLQLLQQLVDLHLAPRARRLVRVRDQAVEVGLAGARRQHLCRRCRQQAQGLIRIPTQSS